MLVKKSIMPIVLIAAVCSLGSCTLGKEGVASQPFSGKHAINKTDTYHCIQNTYKEHAIEGWDFPEILCGGQATIFENDLTGDETGKPASVIRMRHGDGSKATVIQAAEDEKICAAGAVVGAGDFLTLSFKRAGEGNGRDYTLTRRDEYGNTKVSISLQGADTHFPLFYPEYVICDAQGNVHLADGLSRSSYEHANYCVYSIAGELKYSKEFEKNEFVGLMVLSDGRVACNVRSAGVGQTKERAVLVMNEASKGLETVFEYGRLSNAETGGNDNVWMINSFDGENLLFANGQGIFLCDYSMQNIRRIFGWKENGFELDEMPEEYYRGINVDENGVIHLFYDDGKMHFMSFQPFDGEVRELEIACASAYPYREAVYEFNRTHPGIHLTIREDYDSMALITMVTAGEGPVLAEPRLLKDADPASIWEPLSPRFEKAGLLNELNAGAIRLGSRDGVLYYAVPGYSVMTLVTSAEKSDWNYEEFLECMEKGGILNKVLVSPLLREKPYVSLLFCNGERDSYFWDVDTGETIFQTPEFHSFLGLMKLYGLETGGNGQRGTRELVAELKEGKALCHEVVFSSPKDMALFYEIYGDGAHVVGYPHTDGARNSLTVHLGELAVRKSASEGDKEAAMEFLETLLSYDVQSENAAKGQGGFSARKDVLEEQIGAVAEGDTSSLMVPGTSEGIRYLREAIDTDLLRAEVNRLIENADPVGRNDALTDILNEELGEFYEGAITMDQLTEHLDKRISLYLKENDYRSK